MPLCDTHSHSHHSHDAVSSLSQMAEVAIARDLEVLTITDHCDIQYFSVHDIPGRFERCKAEYLSVRAQYEGRLKLLFGIELGEGIQSPEHTADILRQHEYDIVIGSVHESHCGDIKIPYSHVDFTHRSLGEIEALFTQYFKDVARMVRQVPCDTMAHLTCPLRYFNGKFHKEISLAPYLGQIEDILGYIIEHNVALEINTSGIGTPWGEMMPDEEILRRYKAMGGKRITLGSDAHVAQRVGVGLKEAVALLQRLGFESYCYFEKRQPIYCKI